MMFGGLAMALTIGETSIFMKTSLILILLKQFFLKNQYLCSLKYRDLQNSPLEAIWQNIGSNVEMKFF